MRCLLRDCVFFKCFFFLDFLKQFLVTDIEQKHIEVTMFVFLAKNQAVYSRTMVLAATKTIKNIMTIEYNFEEGRV